jgi:SAM-dependent methyltransferase
MGSEGAEVLIGEHDSALRDGHYAVKQIFCKDRLIAWSHRRRFQIGLRLAREAGGRRLLDYGCGDGTFLALLFGREPHPAAAVGAEIDAVQIDDCRARLGADAGLTFTSIADLERAEHGGAYDTVVCMEVLEHVVMLERVLDSLVGLMADGGMLLVSVPVETGLPLLVKQAARRIAGWRGIGDYATTVAYTWREYMAGVFAGSGQHMTRPIYGVETGFPFHDHKGFNWMALRDRLAARVAIERVIASPVPWLGARLATQVWFVCRKPRVA